MKDWLIGLWDAQIGSLLSIGGKLLKGALVYLAGRLVWKLIKKIFDRAQSGKLKVDDTLAGLFRMLLKYTVVLISAIMILDIFGMNTTSLIALLGAAGVAVGLALKDTLSNIAAGIVLVVMRAFRRGDYIEFGGYSGTVREIDLFTTILETPDGIYISAPNSSIWGVPLKNYSRNGKRRMDLSVSISYTDSIDTAFGVMREIIAQETRFLSDPAPQVLVQSLGDSGVTIQLRAWARGEVYWDIYWNQMRTIKEKIEAAGLSIPFPQRDLHIIPPEAGHKG
ncbi:MAG: mechanosensitive ion channel family protein [Treponema sp.]|jgi:small conductance mechanosensitive channel|nr:mechanosensitive ion channel family protein [Treponema sp.]